MSEEVNFKKNFCLKYFNIKSADFDVLNKVDVVINAKNGAFLLYIESKDLIKNEADLRKARAQAILTNKKQECILSRVAVIFHDDENNDCLELLDCSESAVMFNNDINWRAEVASNPSHDAIDRINDRLIGKITVFKNNEIKEFYKKLQNDECPAIEITLANFEQIYNEWKSAIKFRQGIEDSDEKKIISDEQDLINLYLVDMLNGTKYQQTVRNSISRNLFNENTVEVVEFSRAEAFHEGTDLYKYEILYDDEIVSEYSRVSKYIIYNEREAFRVVDKIAYADFWRKYRRPPEASQFFAILEHSARLYSMAYRRDTGGEYTPSCFVRLQNEILEKLYGENWRKEYIVFDPCAGVGNLENDWGKDFKSNCFLSTLVLNDVDTCRLKNFENAICFDFLQDESFPRFNYFGKSLEVTEIARREGKKLMVVMNPPYHRKKGFENNLAIEFFNKCAKMKPDVIVFYYMTESFLRDEIEHYKNSGYKIASHIMSNAKLFGLSEWPISLVVFDREKGESIGDKIAVERYEADKKADVLYFAKTYIYDNSRPSLIKEIDDEIKKNETGFILGNVSYLENTINLTNKLSKNPRLCTTENLKWCLLSKGLNFNTHNKYFERNQYVHKGAVDQIPQELFNDAICFSLFYKNCAFSNKDGSKNYIMPFSAEDLGCGKHALNILFPEDAKLAGGEKNIFDGADKSAEKLPPFDFRQWISQFSFSPEAKDLFSAALKIFKFYHSCPEYAEKRDWNDSFYDIANAIMRKDTSSFKAIETKEGEKKPINITKTTEGSRGFGRNSIGGFDNNGRRFVSETELPIFYDFFDKRDALAKKINRELLDANFLLWERENIY